MKQRSTTPVAKTRLTLRVSIAFALVAGLVVAPFLTKPALADVYDEKINALQEQINQFDSLAGELKNKRQTYQNKLSQLTNERSKIQAQLDLSLAKQKKLENEIKKNVKKLEENRLLLGEVIAAQHIDDKISPLILLASSDNIADYVDKQAKRDEIKDSVNDTIKEIDELKKKLETQQKEVKQVIADQQGQKDLLVKKQNEQQQLIAETQGQESKYQRLIKKNNASIDNLRQQQVAANARFIGGGGFGAGTGPNCGGGYPGKWCNIPMDAAVDSWGMYNRQCVSYAAFKVWQSGAHMPYWGGVGNAHQWDDNARAAGMRVDSNPNVDRSRGEKIVIGISNAGYYGHAFAVESVNGDGTINISQYNAAWTGQYSTATISTSGISFIHFK